LKGQSDLLSLDKVEHEVVEDVWLGEGWLLAGTVDGREGELPT
jgi:hypothetical protein